MYVYIYMYIFIYMSTNSTICMNMSDHRIIDCVEWAIVGISELFSSQPLVTDMAMDQVTNDARS